jgi:hypothetical protein
VLVEGGSVRGQLVLGEEGGGGLRHVHVHAHAHAHCDVWAGAAWADLLYSLLYIPLYRKLLYKAENRCIRRYTRTRVASRPSIAIQLYSAIHYTAVQR